jgi:hypothetical protein
MSRWFRHYAGLCRDEKLVSVAIKAKQPIERVVWVWCAILESAAEIDDAGRYGVDTAEIAYFLRTDEADICSIENALRDAGRLASGCVVAWSKRQFSSDRSKERVAAHRERKRVEDVRSDDSETSRNGVVTLQTRYGNAPELDTELDTELEKEKPSVLEREDKPAPKPRKPSLDEKVFDILTDCLTSESARSVIEHRRAKGAKLTEAAARGLVKEFWKAHSPDDAAETMVVQGWQGFNIDWYRRAKPNAKIIETMGAN